MKVLTFDELINQLKNLLGARIEKGILLIWPTDEDFLDSQELNLKLIKPDEIINVTFCMPADSRSNYPYLEEAEANFLLSELPDRMKVWKTPEFWDERNKMHEEKGENYYLYECFDVKGSEEYEGIIGSRILKIIVYYYYDKKDKVKYPIGFCLEFSTGKKIWSVLNDNENEISTSFPKTAFKNFFTKAKTLELFE